MSCFICDDETITAVAKYIACSRYRTRPLWGSEKDAHYFSDFDSICSRLHKYMAISVATRYGNEMEDTPLSWNWKKAPKVKNPGHIIGYLRCIRYQADNAPRTVREEMETYIEKLIEICIAELTTDSWGYKPEHDCRKEVSA